MSDEPISFEQERNKRLPTQRYLHVPPEHEAKSWIRQLFNAEGKLVRNIGIDFGIDELPGIALSADQARRFAALLVYAAQELEALPPDSAAWIP